MASWKPISFLPSKNKEKNSGNMWLVKKLFWKIFWFSEKNEFRPPWVEYDMWIKLFQNYFLFDCLNDLLMQLYFKAKYSKDIALHTIKYWPTLSLRKIFCLFNQYFVLWYCIDVVEVWEFSLYFYLRQVSQVRTKVITN